MSATSEKRHGGVIDALLDDDGTPPCPISETCPTCRLFCRQKPGETRADWFNRLVPSDSRGKGDVRGKPIRSAAGPSGRSPWTDRS